MKKYKWLRQGILALMNWLCLSVGIARAGVILPVNPATGHAVDSSVTISLFQEGVDVTAHWLPEPGRNVTIVVNGISNPVITLVPSTNSGVLSTSAYPGRCTNIPSYDAEPDLADDFVLDGRELSPTDYGGRAVIQVAGASGGDLFFILPQDSEADGIPDIWEAKFCPATNPNCLAAAEDPDAGAGLQLGDGIANFDEYRGFMVSGKHLRTNPLQKDLFFHLVNPQCGTGSLLGGGPVVYPTDGSWLFSALTGLLPQSQLHPLGYIPAGTNLTTDEWVDNFQGLSVGNGVATVVYKAGSDGSLSDRQINRNAIYPLRDTITGLTIQKGIRITECLDTSAISPVGTAGLGSPNGPDNVILYTRRIIDFIDSLIATGGARQLAYSTFIINPATGRGRWSSRTPIDRDTLISKVIAFYIGHEVGHSVRLTPTVITQRKTTYGYHYAPGSGDYLDQVLTNKVDKSPSGFNTFFVPSLYGSTDLANFRMKN